MSIFKVQRTANIRTSDTDKCDKLLEENPINGPGYEYETEEDNEDITILMNKCANSTK